MKKKTRAALAVLSGAGVLLGAALAANRRAVRLVLRNLTVPVYALDETGGWSGGKSWLGVPYAGGSPARYVDIYVPDSAAPPPLYVIIHGGGFVLNDARSRQAQWMYRYFRDHGFACASVNYRLAQEAPFPGAVEDCKAAIRYLRAHAGEYGYRADRIAVFGESAGGYLAAMCAFTGDGEFNGLPYRGQEELGEVSAAVDVLVDYYGAVELGAAGRMRDMAEMGLPKFVYDIANSWLGPDAARGYEDVESFFLRRNISEMAEEERQAAEPVHYLEKNLRPGSGPAVWIVHGDCDITVPPAQSRRLYSRLSGLLGEGRAVLRLVPGMGHASDPLYADGELERLAGWMRERLAP